MQGPYQPSEIQWVTQILHCKQYSRNANTESKGIQTHANKSLGSPFEHIRTNIGESIITLGLKIYQHVPLANKKLTKTWSYSLLEEQNATSSWRRQENIDCYTESCFFHLHK